MTYCCCNVIIFVYQAILPQVRHRISIVLVCKGLYFLLHENTQHTGSLI